MSLKIKKPQNNDGDNFEVEIPQAPAPAATQTMTDQFTAMVEMNKNLVTQVGNLTSEVRGLKAETGKAARVERFTNLAKAFSFSDEDRQAFIEGGNDPENLLNALDRASTFVNGIRKGLTGKPVGQINDGDFNNDVKAITDIDSAITATKKIHPTLEGETLANLAKELHPKAFDVLGQFNRIATNLNNMGQEQ